MERPIAFVTGASRGIGAASAIALAEAGHDVAIGARTLREGDAPGGQQSPGSLESTAREIEKLGGGALTLQMDLLDRASLERAVAATHERWGRIDVMVNCAIYIATFRADPTALVNRAGRRRALIEIDGERFSQLLFAPYRLMRVAPIESAP